VPKLFCQLSFFQNLNFHISLLPFLKVLLLFTFAGMFALQQQQRNLTVEGEKNFQDIHEKMRKKP
jgi:hypothetical protein